MANELDGLHSIEYLKLHFPASSEDCRWMAPAFVTSPTGILAAHASFNISRGCWEWGFTPATEEEITELLRDIPF